MIGRSRVAGDRPHSCWFKKLIQRGIKGSMEEGHEPF